MAFSATLMRSASRNFFAIGCIIFCCTLNSIYSFAQKTGAKQGQALADSLLNALPKAVEDSNKVEMLKTISFEYSNINADEGIKYGQEGLDIATKLGWKRGIADMNNSLSANYYSKGDYPKSLTYLLSELKVLDETGNKYLLAITIGNIGEIYRIQKDGKKALEYYSNALKMHEALKDTEGIARVTANIGALYCDQKDNEKALEYFLRALKIVEDMGNKPGMATIMGNIGEAYSNEKNYLMAIEYIKKSLALGEELGDNEQVAWSLFEIGNTYLSSVLDTPAVHGQAPNAESPQNNKLLPGTGLPSSKTERLNIAISFLKRSLDSASKLNTLKLMQGCYERLGDAYKYSGNYQLAMESYLHYNAIKDSVFSKENNDKIIKTGLQNEYDKKVADAQKLAALKLQRQRGYTYAGIVGALLLLGFSFFTMRSNRLLGNEKKRSDSLLLNILPEEVANQLKDTGAAARQYDDVTVLFTDFVNFTEAGERMTPGALIEELDNCFKKFDEITSKHKVEKIKTIGDAYLAVCGLPTADPKHAENVVAAALEINTFMQDRLAKLGNKTFDIRLGIHSGHVVAGIVGVKKFAYDIWGDTVNTAARMEQNSEPGKVNISETTYDLVKEKFNCEYRGEIDAKGKGMMKMYYVS